MPIAAAALTVLIGTLVTKTAGLMSRGQGEHDVFSLFGATRMRRLHLLQFAGALPAIDDALEIAVPAAILGAVSGECFGAERGIGVLLQSATMYNYQIPLLWSTTLIWAVASILETNSGFLALRSEALGGLVATTPYDHQYRRLKRMRDWAHELVVTLHSAGRRPGIRRPR